MVETSLVYGRNLLRGIIRYLRSHEPWSVFFELREHGATPPTWLKEWRGDGIISRPTSPDLARLFRKKRIPVVDLNDVYEGLGLPYIGSDDHAIGRVAAEHLLERGFRRFAFCGFTEHAWSRRRGAGFTAAIADAGELSPAYESPWGGPAAHPWEKEQKVIGDWLAHLPRPVGVLACNDMRGQHVLDACQRVGLAVPEEVAVIGVDDDVLLCELCDPPLSSVVPNPERIGYEAAALLDRLMAGEKSADLDNAERFIEPLGVTPRQSTDVLAIDDPHVAAAVRFIREHACSGATVGDVLTHVPLSRTILERRFRKYLGRSPQAEIRSVQLKRVKQLLAETDLRLERIAELAGYEHPEYLSVVFKRETGETPGEYRRQAQPQRAAKR
ncbi:XylR family transcriptional regulator [Planctomycetaceae bacterium SCGC AG-212-D15]|nr:XylR family transcriptional regulator [Planctomycetaceae bacterium SCGC AG-212-D15]